MEQCIDIPEGIGRNAIESWCTIIPIRYAVIDTYCC